MRDLVPAFSDDDRLEVRTLEFADVPEAVDELPSLFAESLRKDPPARNGSAERNSNLRRLDSGHARLLAWADIVFVDWCEWAAVWMSHRLPPETRLVIRLHSYEAFGPWPHLVDWAGVDVLVSEGEHIQRFLLEQIDPREFG